MKILKDKIKIIFAHLIILISMFMFMCVTIYSNDLKRDYVLVIKDRNSGNEREFFLPNKQFILTYTHSVHKTLVKEFFKIDEEGSLILIRTEYDSYGVGLPFYPDEGSLKIEDGKFILLTERKFKELNMSISPIAEHFLVIEDETYYMADFFENNTKKILISVKKR